MSALYGLASAAIGGGLGFFNNLFGARSAEEARAENYEYNEMAAQNADTRTRELYKDIYSPQALLKQYKEAGLSPSVMFGGTPGQGGNSGAQGGGAAGTATPYMPISLLEGAQLKQIMAETEKTKAETANINVDTERQDIQKGIEELNAEIWRDQNKIFVKGFTDPEGNTITLYDKAGEFNSFDDFAKWARDNYYLGQKKAN